MDIISIDFISIKTRYNFYAYLLLILQKCLDPSCSQSTLQSSSKSSTTSQSSKTVIKTFLKQSPGGVPLKISQTSQEYTCVRVSFLKKLQASVYNFIKKETLAQVLSCQFCEIFKNTFFNRIHPMATSDFFK